MLTPEEFRAERLRVERAGLYDKYLVLHADGSPRDPEGQYFVLKVNARDPVHRQAARRAVVAYADSVEVCNPILAHDLRAWMIRLDRQDEKARREQKGEGGGR